MLSAPLDKVIVLNTGSESNEVAMRLAKLATGRFEIVGLGQGFHGLTAGVASITYSVAHRGYGPQMPGSFALPRRTSIAARSAHAATARPGAGPVTWAAWSGASS